jgi:hypothetical protein
MVVTKLFGVILVFIGIYFFKTGLKYDDKVGHNLMNNRMIGIAVLLFIGGSAIIFSSKSLCEIFGIFC